ncbi:MAG TPA: hypothetical protein VFI03_12810 [Solirubrobacterales bacterium]|nr:hypothetical protein [Solirubrobacterales bacterium]
MLGPGRYLLGIAEIALLAGFAWLGASRIRVRLLPRFEGAPAHLATAVLGLALLIWTAELLGTFSLFEPVPYLLLVGAIGVALRFCLVGGTVVTGPAAGTPGPSAIGIGIALVIAAAAVLKFALEVKPHLSTGMTGFDTTWYHGPFAAGFFQSGNTMDLHFIAPQFLAWFYPANGEIFHAAGMLAFGRDIPSPLLNLGWFIGCLVACWCIGRPYRVAPWSLGLGALALSVPALADQAGEARNDIVGIFFLLAAVAIALNAWAARGDRERGLPVGGLVVVGLAAGLAAGTKLNFLLPAGVLVVGLVAIAPRGGRWRALAATGLAALVGGGYWYLRNLVHTGNPLPWIDSLGPISLPAPDQALGGREAHSVLSYLTDGAVWSDWFLPGLHGGIWIVWPLLAAAALAGLVLPLLPANRHALLPGGESNSRQSSDRVLPLVALVGLATAVAWLVAPTSASGPEGVPRGFESGLRYLAPALVLGLALLPTAQILRNRLAKLAGPRSSLLGDRPTNDDRSTSVGRGGLLLGCGVGVVALLVAAGYPIQRHYLKERYADPTFTTPGLNAAFAWSRGIEDSRIATTSTRQYPLFGTTLSNQVQFIGTERPHGGFEAPITCRAWRRELNEGDYDYVVTSRDRIEPAKSPYPPQASWTIGPAAKPILKKPPTVVFKLNGDLDPSGCP